MSLSYQELPSIVFNKGDSFSEVSPPEQQPLPPLPPKTNTEQYNNNNPSTTSDGLRRRVQTAVDGDLNRQQQSGDSSSSSSAITRRATMADIPSSATSSTPAMDKAPTERDFRSAETWSVGSDGSRDGKVCKLGQNTLYMRK